MKRCNFCLVELPFWHRAWCPFRKSVVWGTLAIVLLAFAGTARGQDVDDGHQLCMRDQLS